jgi:hypothetical protein
MSTPNIPDIIADLARAASEAATPEERRAAIEEVLRELSPAVEDALTDRPVALAAWAQLMQGIDASENGFTREEGADLIRDMAELVGMMVTAPLAHVRRRPMSVKAAIAKALGTATAARNRATELSAGDQG